MHEVPTVLLHWTVGSRMTRVSLTLTSSRSSKNDRSPVVLSVTLCGPAIE